MSVEKNIDQALKLLDEMEAFLLLLEKEDEENRKKAAEVSEKRDQALGTLKEKSFSEIEQEKQRWENELEKQQKIQEEVLKLAEQLKKEYGSRFKASRRKPAPRKMSLAVIKKTYAKTADRSIGASVKRLFKIDGYGPQKEMYEKFLYMTECYSLALENEMDKIKEQRNSKCDELQDKYRREADSLAKQADKELNELETAHREKRGRLSEEKGGKRLEEALTDYRESVDEQLAPLALRDEQWHAYSEPESPTPYVYLGDICIPWQQWQNAEPDMRRLFENGIEHIYENGQLLIPCLEDVQDGMKLYLEYETDNSEFRNVLQSVLFQVIHNFPMYLYNFYYFDARGNGKDLGDMTMLNVISDTEVESIHPALEFDSYRILQLGQDRDDIRDAIRRLSEFTRKVSVMLGSTASVQEFNSKNRFKIPYQLIVICNFPYGLDEDSLERFSTMIRQSRRFGMSFILTGTAEEFAAREELLSSFGRIRLSKQEQCAMISRGSYLFPIQLKSYPGEAEKYEYLDSLKKMFLSSFQSLDNLFVNRISCTGELPVRDSTDRMMIPFAVNKRGRVVELELGSSLTAHGLLSGGTGSGKSTLLHSLISSVMLHYRPEDVQLWLVDYKLAEFSIYLTSTPRSIKVVGVQDSEEFTYAFLDYVTAEYNRRMELFKQATKEKGLAISSMREYRRHYGKDSMPRILIIVDEFHKMTQYIQDNEYRDVLENHLSEVRAAGITYLFSDQAVSTGLRGLTEKGRKQIMVRLAMKQGGGSNPEQEIVETIGVPREMAREYNERMDTGHVLFQQQVAVAGLDGREVPRNTLIHCRSLYLQGENQQNLLNHLTDIYGRQPDPLYVDGTGAKLRDEQIIQEYLSSSVTEDEPGISIVLGTPSNLQPCFAFSLQRNYNNNIMCIGENTELRMRILRNTIRSLAYLDRKEICLLCDENDPLFRGKYRSQIKELVDSDTELVTDYAEICERIDGMLRRAVDRQRGRDTDETPVFLFWIGLDNMLSIFQTSENTRFVGRKKNSGSRKKAVTMESVANLFDSLFSSEPVDTAPADDEPEEDDTDDFMDGIYNAGEDLDRLMMQGSRNGIFSFVTYSSAAPLAAYRRIIRLDRFVHRIALKMDENSSGDFLNNKSRMASSELKEGSAVYYDGGRIGRYFIPYRQD